nr:Imm21 family immunity protein [Streptomyces collinus]
MARHGDPGALRWVEPGGGPLVAVPQTVPPFRTGADSEELDTDHHRVCEVGTSRPRSTPRWGRADRAGTSRPGGGFDSARPGAAARTGTHLRVPLGPGPYPVHAAHLRPGPETWTGLVRFSRPAP